MKKEFRLPCNSLDKDLAEQLVAQAREDGVDLVGPDGLLSGIVGQLLETALEVEMTEELGYERQVRTDSANTRNGTSPKTLQTDVGPVAVNVPRDRNGDFDPVTVPKHSRRLSGFDDQVISLYAKGFSTGDIVDHVADIYGSQVSKDLVTNVTDAVLGELVEWQARPLDPGAVYAVVFIDAIYVKIRDGQVWNRLICVAMGINVARRSASLTRLGPVQRVATDRRRRRDDTQRASPLRRSPPGTRPPLTTRETPRGRTPRLPTNRAGGCTGVASMARRDQC